MKKLLVPCDFSPSSKSAFKYALDLAEKSGGEVIVLHTIILPAMYDSVYLGDAPLAYNSTFMAELREDIKSKFDSLTSAFELSSVPVRLEITQGNIISAINQQVKKTRIDMVIMGTTGSSGLEEVFIGSNTEKVIRHSPVPVLAIRENKELKSIKNILLPSTLPLDQANFMEKVRELQQFHKATLHVLLINTPLNFRRNKDARAAYEKFEEVYKLTNCVFHFENYRSEEEGIMDFASGRGIDLIAMATHARKGIAHFMNGSITEDVVNHIHFPVWTYKLE